MPIAKVQLPDGRVGRFEVPDGTTPDQVLTFAHAMSQPAPQRDLVAEARQDGGVTSPEGQPDLAKLVQPPANPPQEPYTSSILPLAVDASGGYHFDPNAGILGSVKSAVTGPGDALQGKFDAYSPEGQARARETASLISPVSPGSVGSKLLTPKIPTTEELRAAAKSGYDNVRGSGVEYSGNAVKQFATDLQSHLESESRIAELNPKLFALIGRLQKAPDGSVVSVANLDNFRKRLGDIAGSHDPAESAAASIAIDRLDKFLGAADPATLVGGTSAATGTTLPALAGKTPGQSAEEAATALRDARGNSAAAFRSDRITGVEDAAELRAAAANSGQNLGNSLRSRIASLLLSHESRGFNPEEITALRSIVEGTPTTNTLRWLSNVLGGGGGLGQSMIAGGGAGIGAMAGGVPGAAVGAATLPVIGAGSRKLVNALTSGQVNAADELVRSRSPLYQQRVANPGTQADVPSESLLLKLLMGPILDQGPPGNHRLTRELANSSGASVIR